MLRPALAPTSQTASGVPTLAETHVSAGPITALRPHSLGPAWKADLAEERPRIRLARAGVHSGERMVETVQQQEVHRGQQHVGNVRLLGRCAHDVEDLLVARGFPTDAVVERRIATARRV